MLPIKFLSFNIKGVKPRNYDYLYDLYREYDIMLLQETWLYKFEQNLVSKILPNSCCCSTSAMKDSDVGRQGRPFGGCMIIWKKSLTIPLSQVETTNNRICAATLTSGKINLLIVSVYMPVDDGSNSSFEEFADVLIELFRLIEQYKNFKVVIGGDFNVDSKKIIPSKHKNLFYNFLQDNSLLTNYDIFDNNFYTYESHSGTRSSIDYFIFSENCINEIENFNVLYDGNNLSDHFPISISYLTNDSVNCSLENDSKYYDYNYNWRAASNEDLVNYRSLLDELLNTIILPQEVIRCTNSQCKQHTDVILSNLDDIINAIRMATDLTIPKFSKYKNELKPGWTKYVKFFKDKSIFWNNLWIEAGRPVNGYIFDIRRLTRTKYHNAIKYINKNKDKILKEKIAESLQTNSFITFWYEIKKLNCEHNIIPSVIDKSVGDINIVNLFCNKYKNIYNEFKCKDNNETLLHTINNLITNKCDLNQCNTSHDVTPGLIGKCVKKLKNFKKDLVYNISSSGIIFGTDLLNLHFSQIFKACICHGLCNKDVNSSVIVPIPKDKRKSLNNSNNYRGISLNTVVSKLFEYVIFELIYPVQNDQNLQFGFKRNHSTVLCSFILNQTIQYYNKNNSNVYALFLDATKAFDRVRYDKLFECLIRKEICPSIIRMIMMMYLQNNACIKWGNKLSEKFSMTNGVKQGSVLSPFLFSLYVEPLINDIIKSNLGCHVGSNAANILIYADDILILAPTIKSLKKLINICENYGKEYEVNFNPNKSTLLSFGYNNNKTDYEDINIEMNGKKIDFKSTGKHLGLNIDVKNDFYDISNIINDLKVRSNCIVNNFCALDSMAKCHIFRSQCHSLYGCQLWDLESKQLPSLEVNWRKCCRSILKIPPRSHKYLIPDLMQSKYILTIIEERILNFIIKGLVHENSVVNFFFKNSLVSNPFSYSLKNLNLVLGKYHIKYHQIFHGKKIKLNTNSDNGRKHWKINLIKELLHSRDYEIYEPLNKNELEFFIVDLCTT